MTDVRDDPRQVLALLNSLGFVGITAPQLKAFMKDLKMYRKIKERERQEWKEAVTKKILTKQETMLHEMLRDTIAEKYTNNFVGSNDSSQHDDPLIRIRVHCNSEYEENDNIENQTKHDVRESPEERHVPTKTIKSCRKQFCGTSSSVLADVTSPRQRGTRSKSHERSKPPEVSTDSSQSLAVEKKSVATRKLSRKESQQRINDVHVPPRPLSAPVFANEATTIPEKRSKSVASDPTGLANARNNPSRCSTRSQAKSFIRPWKLQPETHRAGNSRKSDPVALYQKYQQEWKQISFPGEDQHARLRWAIREKMLGSDPNPRPILKKSQSLMSIKKR